MASVAQFIQWNFTDKYPGAKIYHYAAGTSTLQNVWTDRAKTTTAAQPVVADSDGTVSFYGDGIYKFVVQDSASAQLYSWDNVNVVDLPLRGEGATIASAGTVTFGTDGDFFHITGSTGPITNFSGTQTQVVLVFDSTPTMNHSASIILRGSVNYTTAANDTFGFVNEGAGVWRELFRSLPGGAGATGLLTTKGDLLSYSTVETREAVGANASILTADSTQTFGHRWLTVGTNGMVLMARSAASGGLAYVAALNKYIYGFTYDNNGVDATNDIDILAGGAMDSTGVYFIVGSAITKQLDAAWAVGNNAGGLDTGSIGNSDYYIWAIARSDTGVVDYLFSLSSTAPTMPTSYDFKRIIGFFRRRSAAIETFLTTEKAGGGLALAWKVPSLDVDQAATLTTSERTDALRVPLNFATWADVNISISDVAASLNWFYTPGVTSAAPSGSVAPLADCQGIAGENRLIRRMILTSSTGTIAARSTVTVDNYRVVTLGFEWSRR